MRSRRGGGAQRVLVVTVQKLWIQSVIISRGVGIIRTIDYV